MLETHILEATERGLLAALRMRLGEFIGGLILQGLAEE